ncbi:MAG: glucose-6-phosphate isomerase family protein [Patescibacteria group bacterium]
MQNYYASRDHEKMKEVLMSPDREGPAIHYYMIRGGSEKTNITVWEMGLIGREYIKTYGHYHVGDVNEKYTVLQGKGIIIIQERSLDVNGIPIDDEISNFSAKFVKSGDEINIPKNAGHLMVNVGKVWLVMSDNSPVSFEEKDPVSLPGHADYEPFRKLRGAAYYVVEKDGKPTLVKNPNYKKVPSASISNHP